LIPAAQLQQTIAQFCSQIASLRFLDLDYAPRYGLQLLAMDPRFPSPARLRPNIDYRMRV